MLKQRRIWLPKYDESLPACNHTSDKSGCMAIGLTVCIYVQWCMYVYIYSSDMDTKIIQHLIMKIIIYSVKISSPIGTISNSEVIAECVTIECNKSECINHIAKW